MAVLFLSLYTHRCLERMENYLLFFYSSKFLLNVLRFFHFFGLLMDICLVGCSLLSEASNDNQVKLKNMLRPLIDQLSTSSNEGANVLLKEI